MRCSASAVWFLVSAVSLFACAPSVESDADAEAGAAGSSGSAGKAVASAGQSGGGSGGTAGASAAAGSAASANGGSATSGGTGGSAASGAGTSGFAGGGNPACEVGLWCNISPPGLFDPEPHNPPFGAVSVSIDPTDPQTLWVGSDMEGLWKTTDAGVTWTEHHGNLPTPFSGSVHVDPKNHDHMYFNSGVRGSALGFWVTTDGGETWAQPAAFLAGTQSGPWNNDVGHCAPDPTDFNHVLLTFHSPWSPGSDAGVIESTDGGESWTVHSPTAGWGASASIDFLYSPELGIGDSGTWLLGTPYDGMWRTTDAGATWTKTNAGDTGHGGTHVFYASDGTIYGGATHQMIRSTNNGQDWSFIGPHFQDEYYCVIGDGNFLYAQTANTGYNTVGPQPYIVSAESDGMTWTPYNEQTFKDGPFRMAFDATNGIIYSANWNAGVWSLKVDR